MSNSPTHLADSAPPPLIATLYKERASAQEVLRQFAVRWKEVEQPLHETVPDAKERRARVMTRMYGTTPNISAYRQARCQYFAAETMLLIWEANKHNPERAQQKIMRLAYEANAVCEPRYDAGMVNKLDRQSPAEYKAYFDKAARHVRKCDTAHGYFGAENNEQLGNDFLAGNSTGISRRYMLRYLAVSGLVAIVGGTAADRLNDRMGKPLHSADATAIGVAGGYYMGSRVYEHLTAGALTHREFQTIVKNLAIYYQQTLPVEHRKSLAALHGQYARFNEAFTDLARLYEILTKPTADSPGMDLFCKTASLVKDSVTDFRSIYDVQFADPVQQAGELPLYARALGIELEALQQPLKDLRTATESLTGATPDLKQNIINGVGVVESRLQELHDQAVQLAGIRHGRA